MFVDELDITVESGAGGRGCESYFVRPDRKRVPNGGDGGKGGSVIFRADRNVGGLEGLRFQRHIRAENGESGGRNKKTGRSSSPVVVSVPCGSILYNRQTQMRIRDLREHGDEVVVAEGGIGGLGNRHAGNMRPPSCGTVVEIQIMFKILSDAVLLGFPNSGKSTLLNRLTRAKPKIEPYAFSTQTPQLGVLAGEDLGEFRLCELPGLLKGSHAGKGIGNKFLRHLERTRLIILLLDPYNSYGFTVVENLEILIDELKHYNEQVLDLPRLVVANRSDLPDFQKRMKPLQDALRGNFLSVSALRGDGIDDLKQALKARLT